MIRLANKWDTESLVSMLAKYKAVSPLELHKQSTLDTARKMLSHIFAGRGFAYVSEDSTGIHGMILGLKNPNIWDENAYAMHEIAYWVNPENRGGTAGYKLIKAYVDHCNRLKEQGDIDYFTISKMSSSPDLDYSRFGFRKLEEMWEQ